MPDALALPIARALVSDDDVLRRQLAAPADLRVKILDERGELSGGPVRRWRQNESRRDVSDRAVAGDDEPVKPGEPLDAGPL